MFNHLKGDKNLSLLKKMSIESDSNISSGQITLLPKFCTLSVPEGKNDY